MKNRYTLTITGELTEMTENFEDIDLSKHKITELENLKITNVKKEGVQ